MSWITDLFSSSVANVVTAVVDAIDKVVTSDEERLELKGQLQEKLNNFKAVQLEALGRYDTEITTRHATDMKSDSWLSKNIRPLALAFLTISTVILAYLTIFFLDDTKVSLITPWLNLLEILLLTAYGFYFGSRGFEKVHSIKYGKNKTDQPVG